MSYSSPEAALESHDEGPLLVRAPRSSPSRRRQSLKRIAKTGHPYANVGRNDPLPVQAAG